MIKSWLKRATSSRPVLWLLLAGAVFGAGGWSSLRALEPLPADPQGQAQAAKSLAKKAAAQPTGSQAAPSQEASRQASPQKWGAVEPGRRDPFNIPKPATAGGGDNTEGMPGTDTGGPIPPGKKGLVISQLRLEGVVDQKTSNSRIAVVATPANRAYFLRENDEVYNGVVSKITPDSIYFTENARDPTGQMVSRQVIKKLGSTPGENR